MPGINSGILTNAQPLNAEQIKALEQRVLETGQTIAYLNEKKELCFASSVSAEGIKDLAWNHVYQLETQENVIIKKVYEKTSLDDFELKETLQKQTLNDQWVSINTSSLLDEGLLDEYILE